VKRAAALAFLIACHETPAVQPRAIVIANVEPRDASITTVDAAPTEPQDTFELVPTFNQLCARIRGRVHCSTLADPNRAVSAEAPLGGIDDAVSISANTYVTCVATRRGTVHCMGDNRFGQLGAHLRDESSTSLVQVARITTARRVFVGPWHACAILDSGKVSCWGRNESAQTGSTTSYAEAARELVEPTEVPGIDNVTAVAANFGTTCATTKLQQTWCWGHAVLDEHERQRGRQHEMPARIAGLDGIDLIDANESMFVGMRGGEVLTWGDGSTLAPFTGEHGKPRTLTIERVRKIRVAMGHGCALHTDGTVSCFGGSYTGALGRPTEGYDTQPPAIVQGLPPVADIAVGGSMSCAVTEARDVYCWGNFPHPNGSPEHREPTPIRVRVID
jgi:alpha-tubulin suppressor-like RCC1 family protein